MFRELDVVWVKGLESSERPAGGMGVESTDTDPDKVLADCRAFALRQGEP